LRRTENQEKTGVEGEKKKVQKGEGITKEKTLRGKTKDKRAATKTV